MAWVIRRPGSKTYTALWRDELGKQRQKRAYADKGQSQRLAQRLEDEAHAIRDGLIEPAERTRREALVRPLADHLEDYRLHLVAKGGTAKHARHVRGTLSRLLADAGATTIADIYADRITAALARWRAKDKPPSARTCNHALAAVKGFAAWLVDAGRISELPRGLKRTKAYNEDADRRLVRRALTRKEVAKLLHHAENGEDIEATRGPRHQSPVRSYLTGPERAALYRLAMGTGFRADELRTLTPERFHLEGEEPTITVLACYSKNGKEAVQPITTELAESLRPFVSGKEPGKPVLAVPIRTAQMLRRDLESAGIAYKTADGTADFHSLRAAYITHLIESGANPKVVQMLARHSSITLTIGRYVKHTDAGLRDALEGKK